MKLTVQDIFNFTELNKLTLVAGRGGLKNKVSHCGILDYEYDRDVSNKYYDYNYQMDGEFLTLSTFLYAKNDPNLIYDAVKKLVAKKGSGLIIKNIFKLPISDNVIRYANNTDFPIFVLNDSYPFFEDIIVLINKAMDQYESFYYREQKVNMLLTCDEGDISSISKLTYDINPSLQDDVISLRFKYKRGNFGSQMYLDREQKLYEKELLAPEDASFYYDNGFLLILSRNEFSTDDISEIALPYLDALGEDLKQNFDIGISKIHHIREELPAAIRESIHASLFLDETTDSFMAFDALGPYQAILPNVREATMQSYERDYILPLERYDAERNADILHTVTEFVKCNGSLDKTAQKMNQHKNTIRYRLKRAGEILDLNPFSLGDYERLALALRIYICSTK